jgi:cyclohexanone monooxygenase
MSDQGAPKEFSPEELRERYEQERLARIRPEGDHQYRELAGVYRDFDADPWVEPGFVRDPIREDTDVLIVGAGFGGMTTAAFLRKHGVDSFRIIDKAGDFGGTWYWNRYPGCMCDVESYCYLPLLEESGYMPKHKYAHAAEIFGYCQRLAQTYDMYPAALFQTEVTDMVWDRSRHRWQVSTTRDDQISARFVVICGGVLHKAKLPGIPGIERFQGHSFHTSRWDYGYTGGGPEEAMDQLADKKVAIVGTGATAVQAVPKLAEAAEQLFVFQRTPSAVSARNQRETDPQWFHDMASKPGWQYERIANFVAMTTGLNPPVDMVDDGWTALFCVDPKKPPADADEARRLELVDFELMEGIRARVDEIVDDAATADALKPWYKVSCKRPCFHDDYLPAFNRPNVALVDTHGRGVERITPTGLVVDGKEYAVDCIIYASGFENQTFYTHRLGFDPKGIGGVSLSEAWAHGPWTLHGVHTHGFPNLCMNSFVQGGQHINFAFAITEIARHTAATIAAAVADGIDTIEPTMDAEEDWYQVILGTLPAYGSYFADCTPSYLNMEGAPPPESAKRGGAYMGSALEFVELLREWREEGSFRGLVRTPLARTEP